MKKWMLVLSLIVVCVGAGCGSFDFLPIDPDGQNIPIYFGEAEGVIFYAESAENSGVEFEFSDPPVLDYWTPEQAQVRELEAGLVPFLESEIAADDFRYGFWEDLENYKRQFFGVTFERGTPLIYANYFCVDDFDYWRTGHVMVMDGGECFFQVLYNPATGEFSSLRINGYA
jgi:hypothetical protein